MKANLDPLMNRPGPYFFKVCSQIYHYVSENVCVNANKKPSYGQLYILDSKEATQHRIENPYNTFCNAQVWSNSK